MCATSSDAWERRPLTPPAGLSLRAGLLPLSRPVCSPPRPPASGFCPQPSLQAWGRHDTDHPRSDGDHQTPAVAATSPEEPRGISLHHSATLGHPPPPCPSLCPKSSLIPKALMHEEECHLQRNPGAAMSPPHPRSHSTPRAPGGCPLDWGIPESLEKQSHPQ